MRCLLARDCSREAFVRRADAEIHANQVCGGGGSSRGQCGGGGGVGAVGRVAVVSGECRECGHVGPERGNLERCRCGRLELLLEREVPARLFGRRGLCSAYGRECVLPCASVGVREVDGTHSDGVGLRRNACGFAPLMGAACDHCDESRGKCDCQRSGGSSAWGLTIGRDPIEQLPEPQFEVVVGRQTVESTTVAQRFLDLQPVPLYLSESDVDGLVEPSAAVDAIEACFLRMASGEIEIAPRRRLRLPEGALADMAASDSGLGLAGGKLYAATARGATFVVCLFDSESSELLAVIAADRLGQLRTGAATGVAARHLARADARTLGVIGCGYQAETQVACIRAAVPTIERVVAYCRTPEKLAAFCDKVGAEPGESHRDAAAGDVVVTITSSRDPVLRGEWLSRGTLVAAAGANVVNRRELDNAVLERAWFVCCDWLEQAKLESGDLVEPVHAGVLDWLEVHELHEVVSGEIAGRQSDDDIILFKSNGLAAWDVALGAEAVRLARERGVGTAL